MNGNVFFVFRKLDKDESTPVSTANDSSNIKMIDADFHFFSDTELTTSGNADSRSGSPVHVESVQSDSELEMKFRKGNSYLFIYFL